MPRRSARRLAAAAVCVVAFAVAAVSRGTDRPAGAPAVPPAGPAGESPAFVLEPYLQSATRTSIVVMCETDARTTCKVEYGTAYPLDQTAEAKEPGTVHEIPLRDLQPGAKYFYRVVGTTAGGQSVESKPLTFSTAVGPTDAYSFAVIGDTQKNPKVTGRLAKLMWERRPNFVLHMGDVVDNGPDKGEWVHELFGPCRDLFARVPVYPCIGNHERNHENYYRYFSLPDPEYHYSYQYGNAEFFVIDTNKEPKPGDAQYRWLDEALGKSKARWKFCYHHHPCYSSDSNDFGDTWKGHSALSDPNAKELIALYEKHNVDIVLNGHIHLYERTWPVRGGRVDEKAGVVYLTSGGGGGRLEDVDPVPAFFKNQGRVDYHYCYFAVHGGTLECRAFDQANRLFDSFTLRKD